MELSALEIAYIAGGFAILGRLVGSITTHFLSKDLARRNEYNQAVKEFISAFQEELTRLKLECPGVPIYDIIYPARVKHGEAYAIFRGRLKGGKLRNFKQAWFEYYVCTPTHQNKEQGSDEDIYLLVGKIEKLLEFAKYK